MDTLLGVRGAEAVDRLLANHPVVTGESVQDGLDLLADRRRTHPEGLAVERWGRRLSRLFGVVLVLLGVAGALLVVAVIWADSQDVQFEEFAARIGVSGAALVVPALVLLALAVVLTWVSTTWRHVIALGEARHTVRWAADRPGQLGRGLPVVEPFSGFTPWCVGPAVILWVLAALTLIFTAWLAGEGDFGLLDPLLVGVGLGLAGWLCLRGARALRHTATVASEHLLLLRPRERGLRMTPATALRERFLDLREGGTLLGRTFTYAAEWTVYPLTTQLTVQELTRLREQSDHDLETERELVGSPEQAPVVTVEKPGEESTLVGSFEREYAGGWLVAEARSREREHVWVVVRDRPERFAAEVLPLFGDRHGLEPGSIRLLDEPQQVPTDGAWVDEWAETRSAGR